MKYKKGAYGDMDHYNGELYKIRMVLSHSYLVSNGPDDVDVDWEVGQSHIVGVNALTADEFNKVFKKYIEHEDPQINLEDHHLDKQNSKSGKHYIYEWHGNRDYQLHIDVLGLNLTYKVGKADMEALTNL